MNKSGNEEAKRASTPDTEKEPNAYDVLSDGEWHPVVTDPRDIMPGITQKLVAAVDPGHLFGKNQADFVFDDGAFFTVEFSVRALHEYGMNVQAIGYSRQITISHVLYMTPTGDDHSSILMVPTHPKHEPQQ